MSTKHVEIFEKFSATFPLETVARWVRMVERWEANPKAPNPYNEPGQGKCFVLCTFENMSNLPTATTLQDVHLDLARNETLQLAAGYVPRHKVSMMAFFSMGFDIEDQQYVLG